MVARGRGPRDRGARGAGLLLRDRLPLLARRGGRRFHVRRAPGDARPLSTTRLRLDLVPRPRQLDALHRGVSGRGAVARALPRRRQQADRPLPPQARPPTARLLPRPHDRRGRRLAARRPSREESRRRPRRPLRATGALPRRARRRPRQRQHPRPRRPRPLRATHEPPPPRPLDPRRTPGRLDSLLRRRLHLEPRPRGQARRRPDTARAAGPRRPHARRRRRPPRRPRP
mmetsp:Transcript_1017/g.2987  ORF Transcript_1017/g.2987 Transcript_1017/m.2987 type:complete len:229 (+) Transcript_1017:574-1260(+)